jgi:hypothetical protein
LASSSRLLIIKNNTFLGFIEFYSFLLLHFVGFFQNNQYFGTSGYELLIS